MSTGRKSRYGVNADGSIGPCRAKPENVGRYGCHHASHVMLTRSEYEHRVEEISRDGRGASHTLRRTDAMNPREMGTDELLRAMNAGSVDDETLRGIARDRWTDADKLDMLARSSGDPSVLAFVASNPSTATGTLHLLYDSTDDEDVRMMLAKNPNTPQDDLDALSRTPAHSKGIPENYNEYLVSMNTGISTETLHRLARSSDPAVRANTAGWHSDPDVLHELVNDGNPQIRAMSARNPSISVEDLRTLALDDNPGVLAAVVSNHSTPTTSISEALNTMRAQVRTAEPRFRKEFRQDAARVFAEAARNPSTPPDAIRRALKNDPSSKRLQRDGANLPWRTRVNLVNDEDRIRSAIAVNPSTPTDLLDELSHPDMTHCSLAKPLASNPSTGDEALRRIAESSDPRILLIIAKRSPRPEWIGDVARSRRLTGGVREVLGSILES